LVGEEGRASDIAARPIEVGNDTSLDRVGADREHDGNRRRHRFGRECGWSTAVRNGGYQCNPTLNEFGRKCRKPTVLIISPAGIKRHIVTIDETRLG
jgi:hypothetical protein